MRVANLFFKKQRRAPPPRGDDTLSIGQTRWLGALMLATQLPMLAFVPLWIAGLGTSLVLLRFVLIARAAKDPDTPSAVIRSWVLGLLALVTAIAIRQSMGYFIGRDPCVAFLFALIGIKYLETRRFRDGTLIVCLACLLIVTPFFYSQSLLAAAAAIPAIVALGGTLQVLSRPAALGAMRGGWRTPVGGTVKMFAQGIPLAVVLFLLFPRVVGTAVGRAGRSCRQLRIVRSHGPRRHQRAVAVRCRRVPRGFRRSRPSSLASLLAGPGADGLRRPRMDDVGAPLHRIVRALRGRRRHLHGHARAALEALAFRARLAGQPAANDGRYGVGRRAHRHRRHSHARPAAPLAPAGHAAASLSADVDPARCISRGTRP